MKRNILDENEIDKKEFSVAKSAKRKESFYLFVSGVIFGTGFLMLIINGYYHFKSIEFTLIGREDLIARLGFLSYVTGFIFYPTSIIFIEIVIWVFNKRKRNGMLRKSIYAILGLLIPGILFYGGSKLPFLFGSKEKWIVGILLIALAIFILKIKIITSPQPNSQNLPQTP